MATKTPPTPPKDVRIAFAFWITTLIAGIAEGGAHILAGYMQDAQTGADNTIGLGVRLGIYAAVFIIMLQMRSGKNWARLTLTIVLGIVGTLSLVVDPIEWLVSGGSLPQLLSALTVPEALIILTRLIHIIAVGGGLGYMYTKNASVYFTSR